MIIYLILILIVLLFMIKSAGRSQTRKKDCLDLLVIFALFFLVYSLRAPSVGRDIKGYRAVYLIASKCKIFDTDYVYYENGYTVFQNIMAHIGVPFQAFLAIVNAAILVPIYMFIKRYSKKPAFSALIYLCYIYFEFNMTAVRQAIATSICIVAFICLFELKRFRIPSFIILVLFASLFHRSALICLLCLALLFMNNLTYFFGMLGVFAVLTVIMRLRIINVINYLLETHVRSNSIYFGLNYVFLFISGVLFIFCLPEKSFRSVSRRTYYKNIVTAKDGKEKLQNVAYMLTGVYSFGLVIYLVLGHSTILRATQFFIFPLWILFPNCLGKFTKKSRFFMTVALSAFFILFFCYNTLYQNNFDIVPYKFFWQAG